MYSPCVECRSMDTEFFREGGHFKKKCHECGHIGGPYVTVYDDTEEQSTLGEWL